MPERRAETPAYKGFPVKKRGEKSPFLYAAAPPVREREVRWEALFFFPSSFCGAILYPPPPPAPPPGKKGVSPSLGAGFDVYLCFFFLKATIVYFRKTNGVFLFFIRPSLSEKRKKCLPFPFLPLFYFGFVCTHLPLPFPLYERRKRRKEKKSGCKTEEEGEWPLCPLFPLHGEEAAAEAAFFPGFNTAEGHEMRIQ